MSISRNSAITFGSQIVIFIFATISSVIITRALGPVGKGLYVFVFIISLTMLDFLRLNMDASTVYHLGSGKYKVEEFLMVYLILTLLLSGLVIGLYPILSKVIRVYFLKGVGSLYITIAIFLAPLYIIRLYLHSLLWGLNEIVKYNLVRIYGSVLLTVFALSVILFSKDIIWFVIANIASVFMTVLINGFFLKEHIKRIKLKINIGLMKNLLVYGFKGTLGNLLTSVIYRIGPYMVIFYCGMRGMGYYSIVLYSEFLWHIPSSIEVALFPVISAERTDDKAGLTKAICRHSVFLTYSCAILLIIMSRYLIIGLYGREFSPAILPFCILLPGIAAGSVSRILKSYFNGIGRPEIQTYVSMLTVVITLCIYPILIKWAGITGAALAASLIYLLTAVILLTLFLRFTKSKIRDTIFIKKDDFKLYSEMLGRFKHKVE